MAKERLVIANSGGFWGDDPSAARRQVEGGPIDYLVMDYLAEVTMAILQKQRSRNANAGYPADFIVRMREVLPTCVERGIRIITNAGGVNPRACCAAVEALAKELNLDGRVKVAAIVGDDLYPDLDTLLAQGEPLINIETGQPLAEIRPRVLSANAYIGAAPIVTALEQGANVIVGGRVSDTAVTLAPMIHQFGWSPTDWDRLAAGVIAGHIVECGTQATGGNFTDWLLVESYRNMGFPLIEAEPDGSFVVTKHPKTGGLVSVHTVTEQLLYEIGGPRYLSPDVVARFDSVRLVQEGPDRVRVSGVRGEPAPEKLKVSVSVQGGWRAFGRLIVSGPDALAKASRLAEAFWDSVGGRESYDHAFQQFIGWNACHPPLSNCEPSELLVQFAVRDREEKKINARFAPQLVPRVLGTVPGISYIADQGQPRASEVVAFWPALVSRSAVSTRVVIGDHEVPVVDQLQSRPGYKATAEQPNIDLPAFPIPASPAPSTPSVRVPLSTLCLARSGDKGDTANIGVIARSERIYGWMLERLTPAFVKQHFGEVCEGDVERHLLPNLLAVNFLLHRSLGGGGTSSLWLDAQGKTYAQFLLAAQVDVPEGLAG
jgi:hypothetical protein